MSALEPSSFVVPDVVADVIGWRAWVVVKPLSPYPRLRSANAGGRVGLEFALWPPDRWIGAVCPKWLQDRSHPHSPENVPANSCSCGLYAAKSLEQLLGMQYPAWNENVGLVVVGEVQLAGRVITGAQGWKAQRARVHKLYVPLSQAELGDKLRDVYNVPVELAPWWAMNPRLRGGG